MDRVPFVSLNSEVGLAELGNAVIIICLALIVPFLVTSRIDNSRCEKNLLIEEISILGESLDRVDSLLIERCGEKLSPEEFKEILFLFKKAHMRANYIYGQVDLSAKRFRGADDGVFLGSIERYWEVVTGGEGITPSGYKVDSSFIMKQTMAHDVVSRELRRLKFHLNSV